MLFYASSVVVPVSSPVVLNRVISAFSRVQLLHY